MHVDKSASSDRQSRNRDGVQKCAYPVISLRVSRHQFTCAPSSVFVGEEGRRLVTVLAGAAEVADRVRGHQTVLDVLTARHAGDLSVGTLAVVSTSGDS